MPNFSTYILSNMNDWMNLGSDEQRAHPRAYNQHRETIKNFENDRTHFTETAQRSKNAEDALWWIHRSNDEEMLAEELGYSAPWERLHPDSPRPLLSLGTHFWALIIGNDRYRSPLGGCVNDAHTPSQKIISRNTCRFRKTISSCSRTHAATRW